MVKFKVSRTNISIILGSSQWENIQGKLKTEGHIFRVCVVNYKAHGGFSSAILQDIVYFVRYQVSNIKKDICVIIFIAYIFLYQSSSGVYQII